MILLLDTSATTCKLTLIDGDWKFNDEWQAGRDLSKDLLEYIDKKLSQNNKTWNDISAIGVFEGPGSFTGLRIGLTVANTLASAKAIPIVGANGENWQQQALEKLKSGVDQKITLPIYGQAPNITPPRK